MDSIKRVASKSFAVIRTRAFSISALSVFTAVIILFVSLNLNRVLVVAKERDTYLTGMNDGTANDSIALQEKAEVTDGIINLVKIKVDGILLILRTDAKTVADVFNEANITLAPTDEINMALTDEIVGDTTIIVGRITYEEYKETVSVEFKTVNENSSTLLKGKTQVKQEGKNGSKEITYKKRIINGVLEKTEVVSEVVVTEPVNKTVLVGTKVEKKPSIQDAGAGIALDANGAPLNYKKLYTGQGTAYTSDRGDSGVTTSTGQRAQRGIVAVNPKLIPYGTKLYITSADGKFVYGYAVAGDTGGAVMSGRVLADLFYDTYAECTKFGRRQIKVYVLG